MKQEKCSEKDMAEVTFEVRGAFYKNNCLPGLNDLLHEATTHPMAYNRIKQDMQKIIILSLRRDLGGYKATERVKLNIVWGEKCKGQKRDYDNIVAAGRKLINDALVKASVIKDDNPIYLGYGENLFMYTEEPFVKVSIVPDNKP